MSHSESHASRNKRRKLDRDDAPSRGRNEEITSHRQLRELLVFQQNATDSKHRVNKFKEFLFSIGQAENEQDKAKRLRELKAFCDSQISRKRSSKQEGEEGEEEDVKCFPDLLQMWSFAESSNNESLLTVIPSTLAIFINTISSQLEFRDFGLALCKCLLQKDQLRLLNRGLTAIKSKEHLISPCLRLLTEVVGFDGGAVARLLYAKRDITFKRIEVYLTPNKAQIEEAAEDSRKSTLRRNAQKYVLANLRFQHVSAKSDIIEQHKVIRAFLEHVRKDPRDMVLDILKAVDRDIVQDAALSRSAKTRFFSRWNLERLVTLYGYDRESDEPSSEGPLIANEVHKLLMNICQTPGLGVLLPDSGWYPTGSDPETLPTDDDSYIELGLDSAVYVDRYRESVPVRNGNLSHIAQVLRPDMDNLQIELLVTIFKAAPELVADFFTKKTMFVSDPKPTSSWMAESAFLFSTVQLPVPTNCGWKDKTPAMPPPVSVVIESVLPRPLTHKILTRCLNQNTEIVTLFAVRLLTVAFNKLSAVLKVFRATDHGLGQPFWNQAATKLVTEFCRRCAAMKDVILLFRRTAKEDLQQQEAVTELLACFYDVMPDIAFEEGFDVSLVLVDVLKRLETDGLSADDSESLISQLQHLMKIAQRSASMRWWQQPATMQYSAFSSVFKVLVATSDKNATLPIQSLLRSVLVENSVIYDAPASFEALVSSLDVSDSASLPGQLAFLDNCVCRVAKKPVHYQDLVHSMATSDLRSVSPLVAAIVEQWPFVVKNGDEAVESAVASWIARFLGKLKHSGEDRHALKRARDELLDATERKKTKSVLKKALKNTDQVADGEEEEQQDDSDADEMEIDEPESKRELPTVDLEEIFGTMPTEGKTHNALHRWEKEELEAAIEQGRIAELMLCLCSSYEEVRRQAFVNISRFMLKIKDSNYTEWRTVYILTGELLETVQRLGLETPVPWVVGECAASCLAVLTNPMHKLYGKVNKFLQKAPSWEVEKIPSFWIDKILLHEPELDDGYFEEVGWLLDLFLKGLRTDIDMEIYRRANVFERLLSLYESPTVGVPAKRKVLQLVYRASQVGGSATLATRAAIFAWIQSQISLVKDQEAATVAALASALYRSADQERLASWSGESLARVVKQVTS
ncbi:hypothetical protein ASPZODRAFT_126773 [Penicilliopsis zonata CBS 506.65]|uniref:Ribosome biogenesis protein Urb1 n=1 Tax=Penicilliopsis zonata CBS 506.65 TaxID=1073090 RepID=A0A1L9SUL0_9EURO|nr:hypothetical protein ASPZODRAFT_126773 [Penicilliopsis zonata CBS 506.65]OJJ50826.1 hypothetical protein ASPZODRAFT_126773 [Penicilliopsis zonata CBS 506.65]